MLFYQGLNLSTQTHLKDRLGGQTKNIPIDEIEQKIDQIANNHLGERRELVIQVKEAT